VDSEGWIMGVEGWMVRGEGGRMGVEGWMVRGG